MGPYFLILHWLPLLVSAILSMCAFSDGLNEYQTPARANEFFKFVITNSIPSDGNGGSGATQSPITYSTFSRQYITFNFRGKGNAQVLVGGSGAKDVLTVEIGGGGLFDEVSVYDERLRTLVNQTTITGVTSDTEFRSYWISLDTTSQLVSVGMCTVPGSEQVLLEATLLTWTPLDFSLSGASTSTGEWQFPSDGEALGGCQEGVTSCSDVNATHCENTTSSALYGTCIYPSQEVPAGFGDGVCRLLCGASVVCGAGQICTNATGNWTCLDITTSTSTTTSVSTTRTTPTSTTTLTTLSTSTTTPPPATLAPAGTAPSTLSSTASTTSSSTSSISTTTTTREATYLTVTRTVVQQATLDVGAIVGISLGIIALLAAIAVAAYLLGQYGCQCKQISPESGRRGNGDSDEEIEWERDHPSPNPKFSRENGALSPISLVDLTIGEERARKHIHWNDF